MTTGIITYRAGRGIDRHAQSQVASAKKQGLIAIRRGGFISLREKPAPTKMVSPMLANFLR